MDDRFIRSTHGVTLRLRVRADPPDAPVTVVFAHATGFCADVWDPMAADAALAGIAEVSLDFRAHGSSTRPPDGDLDWSGTADDVLAVIDHLAVDQDPSRPRRFVGAGHSMGGAGLILAEQRRPGTFAGLWCYEPVVMPPSPERADVGGTAVDNPLSVVAARRRADFGSAAEAIAAYSSKPPMSSFRPDALEAYVRGGFRRSADGSITLCCRPEDEARLYRMAAQHQAWEALGSMRCPTVVVRGAMDPPGPASFARALVDEMTDARLEVFDHLGHFGPMEDPSAMAASLAQLILAVTAPE